MDVAINNITTTITVPQVDFNLLKELAKKFGWVIQTEKKSGIEEALEDVKAGRVYHAKDAHDLIKQCLEWEGKLPLFDKHTEAECMDIFDCWIYIVKNMNMFEQMPFSEKYPVFRKLAEIGDLRKLSREELELYDEDIKNMRDIYATRKFDEKKGMEKGMEKEKLATARRLLSMGLSDEQVSTATELPLEDIQKMKE